MKIKPNKEKSSKSASGFALISSILVMSLLMLVALAMLSISSVSTRSTYTSKAQIEANANARMALMIAIGELQKAAGPDQRISVPATQWDADPDSTEVNGVSHQKLVAIYQARTAEDEMKNSLDSDYYARSKNFLTWLVSHQKAEEKKNSDFAQSGVFLDEIALTAHSDVNQRLKADRIPVANGAYAWGIADESMKYRLANTHQVTEVVGGKVADALVRSGLSGLHSHETLDNLKNLDAAGKALDKYVTSEQLHLIEKITGKKEDLDSYLTPHSMSLLTDVKKGGWKHCLNMLLELDEKELPADYKMMQDLPSRWGGRLSVNQRKFSDIELSTTAESVNHDTLPMSLIHRYYQSSHMGTKTKTPLVNDSTNVSLQTGRTTHRVKTNNEDDVTDRYWAGYGHSLRLVPVITRARDIIYVRAVAKPGDANVLKLEFISYPVLTFWNPYNVDVELPRAWCRSRGHAIDYKVTVGGTTIEKRLGGNSTYRFGEATGKGSLKFRPGETKVLFPDPSNSNSGNMNFINEWFQNTAQLANFSTGDTGIEGGVGTTVDISLFASDNFFNNNWKSSQHFDGWLDDIGNYRSTKFHNWAFKLDRYRDILTGGEGIMKGKTLGSLKDSPWPLAIVELGTKSADHTEQPGLLWAFDYPHRMNVTPHYAATGEDLKSGRQASPMQYSFTPLRGETDLSKHLHVTDDADGMHDVMGYSKNPARGSSYLTLCELPFTPLHSLGQLQHLPLQDIGWKHDSIHPHTPTWTFGIGNSWAHPWLSSTVLTENREYALVAKGDSSGLISGYKPMTDRLWAANSLIWDSYTFTTLAPQDTPWFKSAGTARSLKEVYTDFFDHKRSLPNDRIIPNTDLEKDTLEELLIDVDKPTVDAHKILPAHLGLLGGVNINNTSPEVWKLLLASTLKVKIPTQSPLAGSQMKIKTTDKYFVSRFTMPNGVSIDEAGDAYTDGFNGYRELSKDQIDELAEAIVKEIKLRGPFRSLSEFVNRQRVDTGDGKSVYGALQAALEYKSVSINEEYRSELFKSADFPDAKFTNKAAVDGPDGDGMSRARGIPGYVSQADILTPLAPIITARGDTFTIYAYGESKDARGKIVATARCKAVVQRTAKFVDPTDSSDTAIESITELNKMFGRKFRISSFHWLPKLNLNLK